MPSESLDRILGQVQAFKCVLVIIVIWSFPLHNLYPFILVPSSGTTQNNPGALAAWRTALNTDSSVSFWPRHQPWFLEILLLLEPAVVYISPFIIVRNKLYPLWCGKVRLLFCLCLYHLWVQGSSLVLTKFHTRLTWTLLWVTISDDPGIPVRSQWAEQFYEHGPHETAQLRVYSIGQLL